MKIVSYNINGIRSATKNGPLAWIEKSDADIYCFQEVRASEETTREIFNDRLQTSFLEDERVHILSNYNIFYNCGFVPGYAGTMVLTKKHPSTVQYDMGELWKDVEGRTTTIFFDDFKLAVVNAYIPNGNSRLEFKMEYLKALTQYLKDLKRNYSVICVGDFNIAHNEIDITHPKECKNRSVFLPIEREAFSKILSLGYVDCFRSLHTKERCYSWRSYRSRWNSDQMNDTKVTFWKYRIDYIISTDDLVFDQCEIPELMYSDHLPVIANFCIN